MYKLVFLCEALTGSLSPGFDIVDARYFAMEHLPELSEERILASQIEQVHELAAKEGSSAYFD